MVVLVVVNAVSAITPTQTTAWLAWRAARRGWDVRLASVTALGLDEHDHVVARARRLPPEGTPDAALRRALAGVDHELDLDDVGVVLVRTNPARPGASPLTHEVALQLLGIASARGVLVLNEPRTLLRTTSKLSLLAVPSHLRPPMRVSSDRDALLRFVADHPGRCVLKPLHGTHGVDVFFVDGPDTANLAQIVDHLVRHGPAIAQAWVQGGERGDTRLLLLDGVPLTVGDQVAAVRRVPRPGELRSNVAQGGTPVRAADLDPALAIAAVVGPRLRDDGLFLTGLDIVADRVIEVNVFAPGGLVDAAALAGADLIEPVLTAIEAHARGRSRTF